MHLGYYCFPSTNFTILSIVNAQWTQLANFLKTKTCFRSQIGLFLFSILILGFQTSFCVFVSRFVLRALRGQVWKTKYYSDNNVHALHKPRYHRHSMFFSYDCATTNYPLEFRKYKFHHYKNCWFPTTSLHSPLLPHVHDSLSSELSYFLNKLSTKNKSTAIESLFSNIVCIRIHMTVTF